MSAPKDRKPRFDFEILPVTSEPYDLHELRIKSTPHPRHCGGYLVRRDANGRATSKSGQWWVGIGWRDAPEHGPYRTFASARKAVVTDQVLTPVLYERGFRS
jgi:hypothetical protein